MGEIQENFAKVLKAINEGEEITGTKRGKPVAKILLKIEWIDIKRSTWIPAQ
ncbi:MAG: type II toxin-antitoxin system prevent-host-death family antitoxin [Deltaproteobacteria bacterium]|nr:type II toxin-antitoxin system prevent-host-death family antitoxin [Deltaproteobacteria bacterium]